MRLITVVLVLLLPIPGAAMRWFNSLTMVNTASQFAYVNDQVHSVDVSLEAVGFLYKINRFRFTTLFRWRTAAHPVLSVLLSN